MVVSSKDPPGELLRPWGCCPAGAYVTRRSCLVVARGAGRGHGMDGRHPGHHVRLIAVAHGRMVVLVLVGGGQVGSLLAVVEVVGHVGVLLAMAASCARRPGSRNLLPKVRCDTGSVSVRSRMPFDASVLRDQGPDWPAGQADCSPGIAHPYQRSTRPCFPGSHVRPAQRNTRKAAANRSVPMECGST